VFSLNNSSRHVTEPQGMDKNNIQGAALKANQKLFLLAFSHNI